MKKEEEFRSEVGRRRTAKKTAFSNRRPCYVFRPPATMVLGPDAIDCGQDLVLALRKNSFGRTIGSLASALARIGPAPDLLPHVLAVIREKSQHNLVFVPCLESLAGEDPSMVQSALAPLLRDPDPQLQELAAGVLVKSTFSSPNPDLLRIAIASLSSDNLNSQHLGLDIVSRYATERAEIP